MNETQHIDGNIVPIYRKHFSRITLSHLKSSPGCQLSIDDKAFGRPPSTFASVFFSPRFRRTNKRRRQPLRPGCSETSSCSCWKECDKGRLSTCAPVGETAPCPRSHGDAGHESFRWAAGDLRMTQWRHCLTLGWKVNQSVSGVYGFNLRQGDSAADNRHANCSCPAIGAFARTRRPNL